MNYHIYKTADEAGKAAAMMIVSQVLKKKDSVLGLATGSTPVPVYQNMIRFYEEGLVDYSDLITYNLDEYCGLPAEHEQSFCYFMMSNLFDHINIPRANIHIPNGMAADPDKECREYEAAIENAGHIDIQLLGIGTNGHIGFNEPDEAYIYATHRTALTPDTIESNKRFFDSADDVPRHALTMGIGSIMNARAVILLATGKAKAEAVKTLFTKEPSPSCPASILRFHQNVTVLLDEEAASLL